MSRVYWDSMLFIYLIEGNPAYAPRVKFVHEEMGRRGRNSLHQRFYPR